MRRGPLRFTSGCWCAPPPPPPLLICSLLFPHTLQNVARFDLSASASSLIDPGVSAGGAPAAPAGGGL
jgi:hypothetical protein